jgi:hypothetical protein
MVKTHADGSICKEGTQSVPNNYVPCCSKFECRTKKCEYDIRFKWGSKIKEWGIVVPEIAGGGVISIKYCPHCGKSLQ